MRVISSLEHPLVKHWVKLKNDAGYRRETKRVLFEGKNGIEDLSKTIPIARLLTLSETCMIKCEEHIHISTAVLKKITSVETSDGIIAELERPEEKLPEDVQRLVVFDRIQDPGNLGTIIRTAFSLGWDAIFLLPGCCDPFNPKAIRASKGSCFLLPLYTGSWDELTHLCQSKGITLVAAQMQGEALGTSSFKKIALVLGNEGEGVMIPDGTTHKKITIKMQKGSDSMNVAAAAAILLYCLHPNGAS